MADRDQDWCTDVALSLATQGEDGRATTNGASAYMVQAAPGTMTCAWSSSCSPCWPCLLDAAQSH